MSTIYNLFNKDEEMPMKTDRMMSIIIVLLERKRVSAQELADMFEVSLRTIYRDIDAIDLAGIPIRTIPGVGGGIEIMPNYKLNHNVFSTSDLSTILTGLSSVSDMTSNDTLTNVLTKVKSLIPPEKEKDIVLKTQHVHIDLSSWFGNRNVQSYLEIIKEAIESQKLLTFTYYDRFGNSTQRTVEPYQLVLKGNRWYWHGYCLEREDYRIFRLSRLSDLKMTPTSFERREYSQVRLDVSTVVDSPNETVALRVQRSLMDRVMEYCSFYAFTAIDDTYYLVDFPFMENDYYYNILLSFGDKSECLAPKHVRQELRTRIQRVADLYK